MKKRLISLLLAFSMVISLLPVGAFAETPTTAPAVQECQGLTFSGGRPDSQNKDRNKGWTYDGTTLTILDGFQLSGDSTLRVSCPVVNWGTIAGGIFTGTVTLPAGHDAVISGGVFYGDLNYVEYYTKHDTFHAKVTGGVFTRTTAVQIIDKSSKTYTISTKTSFVIRATGETLSGGQGITVVTDASNQCGYEISLGAMEIKNINGQDTQAYCTEHVLTYQLENATYREYSLTVPADHVYSEDITLNEEIVLSIVDGYPKQSNGGQKDVTVGDGWSFTASTDAAHPENGTLTLTGSDMDLGSTPVACKVVLRGTSSSNYASIADGTFQNTVTLEKYATLKNGTYNGAVSFKSPTTSITNGTFNAEVKTDYKQFDNETPKISGGAFNKAVNFPQGVYIFGGTFEAPVTTDNGFSCISGGIFKSTVTVIKGYVSGGIFAGTVTLSESGGKYGGLYRELPTVTLDGGSEAPPLIWTLTASGDDSYTFNDALTLSAGSPLYLAAPYDMSKYEFYITGSDLKYANQIPISVDTAITADGTLCGSIAAAPNRYKFEFAPTQSATVLLQSALDPLEIEADGYPKGTEGGTKAYTGEGWSYARYAAYGEGAAKGWLDLTKDGANNGIFDAINSDHTALCNVQVNTDVTLSSGSFAGTVTCYGMIDGGTFSGKVDVAYPHVHFNYYPTIKGGTFTETSEVTVDSFCINGGTFHGTVTNENEGDIKDGTFYGTVINKGTIEHGIFHGPVTNTAGLPYAIIKDGKFYGPVTNKDHIKGGKFYGTVTNVAPEAGEDPAVIQTGEFNGPVINGSSIWDGTFTKEVTNNGTILDGTFSGNVTNNGTVDIGTFTGEVTNRGTVESGTFTNNVVNYGTLMGGTFSSEVLNGTDPENEEHSGTICFSTEDGVYAPPLFTETSTVYNMGTAKILDGTFLGTVTGMVEGGVYVHKPESTTSTISRMTYRYQGSNGNGKTGALTINYEIPDAAYVVNSDTTHVFVTLTNLASPLENINGETFSETACGPRTWALYGKLPNNDEQIILNKATSLAAGDLIVNLPGGESHKVVYDGQPHEATIELVSDALNYLLDDSYGYETVPTEDGGRTLKIYYKYSDGSGIKDTAPTKIGTYEVLYRGHSTYYGNGRVFEITENSHSVTVTDGFIVKVEHPGAVDTDDTTGDDTTEDPISTATVQYGDKVTVTIDASKFPSGMVFDRWETTPVDLPLTPADGESYKTVTFTMPAEDVTLRAVPCTVEEKAASGGSSPLGTAALVVVGGAAAGVLVWQGYELGTELYLHSVLPSGVAIPETRGQLAVVLWQAAGSPAPAAPLAPDAADTQKAMAWVVEHALLEDKTGNFDPREPVNKTDVIRAWNQLNKQGLAQQAK